MYASFKYLEAFLSFDKNVHKQFICKKKKRLGEKRIAGELSTEQVNLNIDTKESYKHSFKRN